MRDSAEYFGFAFDQAAVERALAGVRGVGPLRLRLLVARDGRVRLEESRLEPGPDALRVGIADVPVDDHDRFLFHKTTNRAVYDDAQRPGFDDMILRNTRGQVTESTRANIVVERRGEKVTPPVSAGLLAGTMRAEVLSTGEVREGILTLEDLKTADQVWLLNSVRGWQRATLAGRSGRSGGSGGSGRSVGRVGWAGRRAE